MAVEGASHGMFSDAEPATAAERRAAVVIVLASAALFLVCLPFAKLKLAVVPAFIRLTRRR